LPPTVRTPWQRPSRQGWRRSIPPRIDSPLGLERHLGAAEIHAEAALAAAEAGRAIEVDRHVAELAAEPGVATHDAVIVNDPATDVRAHRQEHDRGGAPRDTERPLAERQGVRVVVHERGNPGPGQDLLSEPYVGELGNRMMRRLDHHALLGIDGRPGTIAVRGRLDHLQDIAGARDETAGDGRRSHVDRHHRDLPIRADRVRSDRGSSSLE